MASYFLRPRKRKRSYNEFEAVKKVRVTYNTAKKKIKTLKKKDYKKKKIPLYAPEDTDWDEWVSATKTRNYLLKDPLLDWIEYNYSPLLVKQPKLTKKVLSAVTRNKRNNFTEFIMEQGNRFEDNIIKLMSNRFGPDKVKSVGGELSPHSPDKVKETIKLMNEGIPFIHSGLLHNPENKTYGIPDLIVRSDWLDKLVLISPLDKKLAKIPAPKLKGKPKYHYRIVDIKFTTLNLRSDGIHILNSNSFPAYKSQLWIYNEALARYQGYKPDEVYILGRRWKFTSKSEIFKGNSCFEKLGVINYKDIDASYPSLTKKAINWIRDVRSEASKDWNITKVPLEREELYPNMSNSHDYPWHSVKKQIANSIGEITSLWMVGTNHRKRAHEQGVYKWTDKECTTDVLGINGIYTKNILEKIIDINRPRKKRRLNKILPFKITNNLKDWQTPENIEFYVDFETVNDVLTDFEDLPEVTSTSIIFMIGVGYIDPLTKKWEYKNFTVDSLSDDTNFKNNEQQICKEFSRFISETAAVYNVKNPLCIHWAAAENNFWNNACERHSEIWESDKWEWFDLLKVFKQEPIVIEGCLNFSLKTVAKAMKKHDFIKTIWDKNSSCLDGQSAMIGAWKSHKDAKNRGISMRETPEMKEITKYNEVDVKVLQEIIEYLRNNHC